ncbi:hypothetical protein ABZX93_33480 [Streptomyces sp. NPDC006632]|uniref:hypothetical protein n=1 Tax=Streptomyces sp. NPDC006632 TaxID=3157182 RepID=UPI0033A703D9
MTAKHYRFSVLRLLIRLQNIRLPRKRTLLIPFLGVYVTLMVAAQSAWAKDITPVGVGDLLPSVSIPYTKGQGTLYEEKGNPLLYTVDSDYGVGDVFDPIMEVPADICMALTAVIGSAVVTIVTWIFNLTTIPSLENAITASVGGAAKTLTTTLLPSAMAVGALIAWSNHRKASGSSLSQLGWVAVSTIFSISLLTSPQSWVNGIDSVRNVGASVAMNATSAGLGDGTKEPIDLGHQTTYGNNERDNMLRKSSDAVWRTYVVTPWCVTEFGSLEMCRKYGSKLLDQGISKDDRKNWLQDRDNIDNIGEGSRGWMEGHNPVGRIMVAVPALICVILFAALVLMLAFASLASLLGALMLLLSGVIFACLWIIPGRPRTWGVRWFDTLLGYTLQSGIATMTLGSVLVVTTASTKMMGDYGYAAAAGISIATGIVAFKFKGVMESIVGVTGLTSPAAAIGGLYAARAAGKAGWGLTKAVGRGLGGMRMPKMPRMPRRGGGGGGDTGGSVPQLPGGGSPGAMAGARRPMPPLPSGQSSAASLPGSSSRREVGPLTSRPELPSSVAPARGRSVADGPAKAIPGTRRPVEVTGSAAPRPALAAGSGTSGAAAQAAPQPAQVSAGRPSPTLRPEAGANANYAFRQGPRPGTHAPKVIKGEVIRSTSAPNRSTRPGGSVGPNPTRPQQSRVRDRGRRLAMPGTRRRGN